MYTKRRKKFSVTITNSDREVMRVKYPGACLEAIDRRAVARAAAREVFASSKSTAEALDSLTCGVPRAAVIAWAQAVSKQAA